MRRTTSLNVTGAMESELNLFGEDTFRGVLLSDITDLFEFWKTTFNKRSTTQLDDTRKTKIASAIKLYGMDNCRKAILGCSKSKWHTGVNPGGKQYTDLTLIFRNADKVEKFLEIYESETSAASGLDAWLDS